MFNLQICKLLDYLSNMDSIISLALSSITIFIFPCYISLHNLLHLKSCGTDNVHLKNA